MDCQYPTYQKGERLVCLGDLITCWDKVGNEHGLKSDSDIATYLLKFYEDISDASNSTCVHCLKPLALTCATCGALQKPSLVGLLVHGGSKLMAGSPSSPQSPENHDVSKVDDDDDDDDDDNVDLLDSDPTSPTSMQVARAMVQLSSFSTGGMPIPRPTVTISSESVTKTPDGMHTCPHCGCKFSHQNGLTRHLSLEMCYTKPQEAMVIQQLHPRPKPKAMKTMRCVECSLEFLELEHLNEHMKIHTHEMPYKCCHCGVGFLKKTVLDYHLKTHEGKHVCQHCGSEFASAHGLTAHFKTQSCGSLEGNAEASYSQAGSSLKYRQQKRAQLGFPINKNTCRYCGKGFASPSHLKRHLLTHTGERPFVCQECGASFTQKSRLVDHHNRNHVRVKPIKCGDCRMKFDTNTELDKHVCQPRGSTQELNANSDNQSETDCRSEHSAPGSSLDAYDSDEDSDDSRPDDSRPFKCEYCKAEFTYSTHYTAHIQKHTGQKEFRCPHCDRAFGDARYLKQHLRKHTHPKPKQSSDSKPLKCHLCGSVFKHRTMLKKHLRVHTGEKPYLCNQCGKSFAQRCNYRRHIRIHTGEKPYVCKECGQSFAHRTTYVGHTRAHTGVKPYKCRHCDKAFRQSYGLTIHMRTHTKEKPYKCTQCSAAFSHPSSLTVHTRTHTGEKPFKCPECGQCFATASNRTAHVRKTHKRELAELTPLKQIHAIDTPIHTSNALMHASNTSMHMSNAAMHTLNTQIHTSNAQIHPSNVPIHTSDAQMHALDMQIHTTNSQIITTNAHIPIHANNAQIPMHTTNSVMINPATELRIPIHPANSTIDPTTEMRLGLMYNMPHVHHPY